MPIIKFQASWKQHFPWVEEGKLKWTAHCTWCNSSFSYDGMGRSALTSHAKGKKHQAMATNRQKSIPINQMLKFHILSPNSQSSDSNTDQQPSTSSEVSSEPLTPTLNYSLIPQQAKSTLEKCLVKDSVTEAEILWCVNTVMNHDSLRSSESSVLLFGKMFKSCQVAQEMKLHKDKIGYSIIYGLAPYFTDMLKASLEGAKDVVIGFDESFNKIAQRTQMDLSVRFWDDTSNTVHSRYLGSVFLNQCKATDLLEAFKSGLEGIDCSKILQVSMDGPNVNWSFLKLLKQDISHTYGPNGRLLLELGSCGLHTIHNAFKTGIKKMDWCIIKFLRALYNLFKMVPARRGYYTEVTGSAVFPLQFCTIRWLENSRVAQRAIEMLPNIKKYVEAVLGTDKEPTSNSFKIVQAALEDKLLLAKLSFFEALAKELEPFLREFQTDKPMTPFLFNELTVLMKGIMDRFVKKEKMVDPNFSSLNVFEKEDNLYKSLMKVKDIDLGYGTRSALRKCDQVKDRDILGFRKEVRTCYQHLVDKIQEKSPLAYPLTKALSFLNPLAAVVDEEGTVKNMEAAFDILITSNVITASDAESADREFKEIIRSPLFKMKAEKFSRKSDRVDSFWLNEMHQKETIKEVSKKCLVLSHGNASLERGFSVNKEILVENMSEEYMVSRRIIHDAVSAAGGLAKWSSLPIPKKMIHAMRNSYSRYKEAEEQRRKVISNSYC